MIQLLARKLADKLLACLNNGFSVIILWITGNPYNAIGRGDGIIHFQLQLTKGIGGKADDDGVFTLSELVSGGTYRQHFPQGEVNGVVNGDLCRGNRLPFAQVKSDGARGMGWPSTVMLWTPSHFGVAEAVFQGKANAVTDVVKAVKGVELV